jgi:hypothetical protein
VSCGVFLKYFLKKRKLNTWLLVPAARSVLLCCCMHWQ